jgi:SNF2 family DNA or RNA helicase
MVELRAYQREGVEFIKSRPFTLLADDMGLGKTVQAIIASKELSVEHILVLCPATLQANWIAEFEKFWPEVVPLRVTSKLKVFPSIAVASYDYAKLAKARFTRDYDFVVLDEAHYLKNRKSSRAKAVLGKGGIVSKAKRVVAMTGTPVEKSIADVWAILYSQKVTKLDYYRFAYTYCDIERTPFGEIIKGTKASALPEIKKMLAPVALRREKADVAKDLPELAFFSMQVDGHTVNLSKDMPNLNSKLIKAEAIKKLVGQIGKPIESMTYNDFQKHGASFMELNHYNALAKVPETVALAKLRLEESNDNKVVVFTNFSLALERILDGLQGFGAVCLCGDMSADSRGAAVIRFQNDKSCRVIICNIATAGAGITLTASDYELFNDVSFSATANAQAIARCHRIGAVNDVTAIALTLSDNKIDAKIFNLVHEKMKASEDFLKLLK